MSNADLIQRAKDLLESRPGYSYNTKTLATKIEAGLDEGDTVQQGSQRLRYEGGNTWTRQNRAGGGWDDDATMDVSDEQMDALLVQVAAMAARTGTHMEG